MPDDIFTIDVAFSFLQKDEELALEVSERLNPRLKTFIFSEKQAKLAGADGETKFNSVFQREARLVVILFRNTWGETQWTRIEQTAIRNRGLEKGYDFTLFVILDSESRLPEWVPKNRIWFNFNRFGIDGLAASIETRLGEFGIEISEQTIEEKANKINRQLSGTRRRREFLESPKAIAVARQESRVVYDRLKQLSNQITKDNAEIELDVKEDRQSVSVFSCGFRLQVLWEVIYNSSIKDATMFVSLSEFEIDHQSYEDRYQSISEFEFDFSMNVSDDYGWRVRNSNAAFYSSHGLAEFAIQLLLTKISEINLEELSS